MRQYEKREIVDTIVDGEMCGAFIRDCDLSLVRDACLAATHAVKCGKRHAERIELWEVEWPAVAIAVPGLRPRDVRKIADYWPVRWEYAEQAELNFMQG